MRAELHELRARVEQLEAGRGPRDRWDAALVAQLGLHFSEAFCTSAVFALATVTPALEDALDTAMIDNPIALGRMLGVRLVCRSVSGS